MAVEGLLLRVMCDNSNTYRALMLPRARCF